jgi:hypothetical protein
MNIVVCWLKKETALILSFLKTTKFCRRCWHSTDQKTIWQNRASMKSNRTLMYWNQSLVRRNRHLPKMASLAWSWITVGENNGRGGYLDQLSRVTGQEPRGDKLHKIEQNQVVQYLGRICTDGLRMQVLPPDFSKRNINESRSPTTISSRGNACRRSRSRSPWAQLLITYLETASLSMTIIRSRGRWLMDDFGSSLSRASSWIRSLKFLQQGKDEGGVMNAVDLV